MNLAVDLVSVHEAALMLKVDRTRINVLLRQGRFAGAAKIGRNWIIPRKSVEEFERLKPGVKPKTAKRKEDAELIARTLLEMEGVKEE